MTSDEFTRIANILRTTYSSEKILPNSEAMTIWYDFLKDIPYDVAAAFTRKWISNNKWSPKISEIRAGCAEIMTPELKDYAEAWENAVKAIQRYGRYEKRRALASLDEPTRKAVEYIGYESICNAEGDEVTNIRAQFRNAYVATLEREKSERQTPVGVREFISAYRIGQGLEAPKLANAEQKMLGDGGGCENPEYVGSTFDRVERNEYILKNLLIAQRYVDKFCEKQIRGNLVLWGGSGTGKTLIADCIKTALESRGKTVRVISRNADDVEEPDLLIVDCKYYPHEAMRSISKRMDSGKPMIVVSGMTLVNMQDYPDTEIQSMYKRLIQSGAALQFTGPSYRARLADKARENVRKAVKREVMP